MTGGPNKKFRRFSFRVSYGISNSSIEAIINVLLHKNHSTFQTTFIPNAIAPNKRNLILMTVIVCSFLKLFG